MLLTTWSVDALRAELENEAAAVYLLTNSRSMPLEQAQSLNAEIGRTIQAAVRPGGRRPVVVSRSDSTLRGHFPGEVDALATALGDGFDATLLIPAFIAGGRYTINDIHYVADGDRLIPAGETDFARDATFGYRASYLREWVAEQTREPGFRDVRSRTPNAECPIGQVPCKRSASPISRRFMSRSQRSLLSCFHSSA